MCSVPDQSITVYAGISPAIASAEAVTELLASPYDLAVLLIKKVVENLFTTTFNPNRLMLVGAYSTYLSLYSPETYLASISASELKKLKLHFLPSLNALTGLNSMYDSIPLCILLATFVRYRL